MTATEAIGVMPPEVVSLGEVKGAKWSSDGQYLLALRQRDNMSAEAIKVLLSGNSQPPVPSQDLVLWSARTHKASVVMTSNEDAAVIAQFDWLVGSQTALVTRQVISSSDGAFTEMASQSELLLLTASTGRVRSILPPAEGDQMSWSTSPTRPLALVQVYATHRMAAPQQGSPLEPPKTGTSFQVVGAEGPRGKPIAGSGFFAPAFGYGWSPDGANCYVQGMVPKKEGQGVRQAWFALDFAARTCLEAPKPQFYRAATNSSALQPAGSQSKLTLSDLSADVHTLWLISPVKSDLAGCLICADVSTAELSPAGDGIFYVSQGIGYVRPFVRLPKDLFLRALADADRSEAMTKAKQAALALIMYASDNNDILPAKEGDIKSTLMPYIRNGGVLDGFVYTFNGGDMSKIDKPAETEIGYTVGPGGRAVAYADGHVKWRSDGP